MSRWSAEQVVALAPDERSVQAARGLAGAARWVSRGAGEQALWGECKGSDKAPYQVVVDVRGPAYRCTCPSRKLPCKHVLALLLAWSDDAVPAGDPPPFAAEWLGTRAARAAARPAPAPRQPDPEARARRAAQREQRVDAGIDDLETWLRDLVRQGLAAARERPWRFWEDAAARLVDAQAPALAGRVRRMGALAHSGEGWHERLLAELGRVALAVRAWRRADTLDPATLADLKTAIGWPVAAEEVRARGPSVAGAWTVLGRRELEEDRLVARRTWLAGEDGRPALLTEFVPRGAPLGPPLATASRLAARLAYYPGAAPLRALALEEPRLLSRRSPLPDGVDVAAALNAWAATLAANPWAERRSLVLAGVTPHGRGERWHLRDSAGRLLPLSARTDHWRLVAHAGGAPLTVAGEWDGTALEPLTAGHPGEEPIVL